MAYARLIDTAIKQRVVDKNKNAELTESKDNKITTNNPLQSNLIDSTTM